MLCVSPVSTSLQRRGSRHLPSPPRLPDERPTVRRLRAHGVSKLTSGLRAHWAPSASQRSVAPQREAHGLPAPGVRRLQAPPPPPPLPHSVWMLSLLLFQIGLQSMKWTEIHFFVPSAREEKEETPLRS